MQRHTESEKLEKDEIRLFKLYAKHFRYDYLAAKDLGISRQKYSSFKKTHRGNYEVLGKVRDKILQLQKQAA